LPHMQTSYGDGEEGIQDSRESKRALLEQAHEDYLEYTQEDAPAPDRSEYFMSRISEMQNMRDKNAPLANQEKINELFSQLAGLFEASVYDVHSKRQRMKY
ncbi:hypothetical protein BGW38_006641, partial [Lunasporangiospora selenospora]